MLDSYKLLGIDPMADIPKGKIIYISDCTSEIYVSFMHMVVTIILDMIYYPKCRTWKMFCVKKEIA